MRSDESGQVLLMTIVIGVVLVIAVTVVIFVNQAGTLHQTARSQAAKSEGVAEQGIAYAIQELSTSTTTWQNALASAFPADCNSGNVVTIPFSESSFKLYCSTGTAGAIALQSYQMAVTAVALAQTSTNQSEHPVRAVRAILSRRTLGADLANNFHAAAALQMINQPSIGSSAALTVHWGPIVCLDAVQGDVWTLPAPIDAGQYPRKISAQGITGTAFPRAAASSISGLATDQEEYWAYAPMTPPPLIDESTYIQQAQNEMATIPQPISKASGLAIAPINCSAANPTNCGYFGPPNLAPGDTAKFGSNYQPPSGAIIYVNGSAEFVTIKPDTATFTTFIVTGALYINDSSGGNQLTLNVPWSASLEYPYSPATQPCQGQATCASDTVFPGNVQFRGFLYVKGNLFVNTVGWTMVGSLLVGDTQASTGTGGSLVIPGLTGQPNSSLNLVYDDQINHSILVSPISPGQIRIEPDSMQDVPAF